MTLDLRQLVDHLINGHWVMVQDRDPGAVGAGALWLDITGGATLDTGAVIKQRNAANTGWLTQSILSVAPSLDPSGWVTHYRFDRGSANTADASVGSGLATQALVAYNVNARGNYGLYRTGVFIGDPAGIYSGYQQSRREFLPRMYTAVEFPDVTNIRSWVGLFTSDPISSDTIQNHSCGFRYSTDASDTTWQCHSRDGSASEITDSGVAVATGTRYEFHVVVGASDVNFYINGALVATHSTHIPSTATNLGVRVAIVTRVNAAKDMYHSRTILQDRF